MRRTSVAALAAASLAVTAGISAQDTTPRPPRAFRFERPIDTSGQGPRRLAVDLPLLSGARPDLGDVRLYDAAGNEIPYLLLQPSDPAPFWATGSMLPIPATEKTSGFEADFGEPLNVDALRVTGLPVPLLKRLSLEGSSDREHWTVLLAEATLFDLPGEDLRQLDVRFAPGEYRYLRVTWNDANSGRVPLPALVEARRSTPSAPRRPRLTASIAMERRPSEPGTSRYRLRLPAPGLPVVALTLVVDNERVLRDAVVTEPRLSGAAAVPIQLGRATLKRIVRDAAAAESLEIPIARPTAAQMDLAVDDGSNPPLRLASVVAVFERQPDVYFEAPESSVVARYGDARLPPPRYDLAAARDTIRVERISEARWGEPRSLVPEAGTSASSTTLERGAPVDLTTFSVVRPIPEGEPALVSLEMDAAALAHSTGPRRRFSDVRVVDPAGRQVPYLLEKCAAPLVLDVPLERASGQAATPAVAAGPGNVSEYAISLPYADLPEPRLVLTTSARVFSRRLLVGLDRPADRRHRDPWFETLADVAWRHDDNTTSAPPLIIPLTVTPAARLALRIEEGDNAPLPLTGVRLVLPGYRLRFYRGAADRLQLAYGRPGLEPPRYDIQLLAADVLGSSAHEIRASGEPSGAATHGSPLVSPWVFWFVLGAAVVILLGLVARLVRAGAR